LQQSFRIERQNQIMNILLIEDEKNIADFIISGFESESFTVHHDSDGFRGLNTALIKNLMPSSWTCPCR